MADLPSSSGTPPELEVTPTSIRIDHAGDRHTAFFTITRPGGAPTSRNLEVVPRASWLSVTEIHQQDTRMGVTVEARLADLEVEQATHGTIEVRGARQMLSVRIEAPRFDITRAIARYRANRIDQAKETCRRLLDSHPEDRCAAYMLAALYLDDHNFPAATRLLQDAAASLEAHPAAPRLIEVPTTLLASMLAVLGEHFEVLKPLEYGISLFEDLRIHAPGELRAEIEALLRQGFVRYLQDRTEERRQQPRDPEQEDSTARQRWVAKRSASSSASHDVLPSQQRLDAMPPEEIRRLLGYVDRAERILGEDACWGKVRTALQDNLAERSTRTLHARARLALALVATLACCYAGVAFVQERALAKARTAFAASRYEEAQELASRILPVGTRGRVARSLEVEALIAWAEQARKLGDLGTAASRLQRAESRGGIASPARPARLALLDSWATSLIEHGRYDLALEKLDEASTLEEGNPRRQKRKASLSEVARLYSLLRSASGRRSGASMGEASSGKVATRLTAVGCPESSSTDLGGTATQVVIIDLDGHGPDELVISGHPAGTPRGATHVAVYQPHVAESGDGTLRVSFTLSYRLDTGKRLAPASLQTFTAGALGLTASRAERAPAEGPQGADAGSLRVLQIDVPPLEAHPAGNQPARGRSTFLYPSQGHLRAWTPPASSSLARVRGLPPRSELAVWTWKQMPGSTPQHPILLPVPYRWAAGAPSACPERYADYYLDEVIPDLQKLAGRQPFGSAAEKARFSSGVRQAIAQAQAFARR